ncbi:MAG: chemotaxis protein CheC [Candidatus Anammoxibacter sp.]
MDIPIVTDEEKEILQELMNIAFGKASAELAEFIDINVVLSIPYIDVLKSSDLPDYIKNELKGNDQVSILEQKYWGEFKGDALLIFPSEIANELITVLDPDRELSYESDHTDMLARESLMEVGNILVGACVGKMAELLKGQVTYTAPRMLLDNAPIGDLCKNQIDPDASVILLKTTFRFNERDVDGFLFLLTSYDSINWLKKSLREFMEQYR